MPLNSPISHQRASPQYSAPPPLHPLHFRRNQQEPEAFDYHHRQPYAQRQQSADSNNGFSRGITTDVVVPSPAQITTIPIQTSYPERSYHAQYDQPDIHRVYSHHPQQQHAPQSHAPQSQYSSYQPRSSVPISPHAEGPSGSFGRSSTAAAYYTTNPNPTPGGVYPSPPATSTSSSAASEYVYDHRQRDIYAEPHARHEVHEPHHDHALPPLSYYTTPRSHRQSDSGQQPQYYAGQQQQPRQSSSSPHNQQPPSCVTLPPISESVLAVVEHASPPKYAFAIDYSAEVPPPPPLVDASRAVPARRRGKKVEMACGFCRTRKLKCDGERPVCGNCTKRGYKECEWDAFVRRRGPGKKKLAEREAAKDEAGDSVSPPPEKRKRRKKSSAESEGESVSASIGSRSSQQLASPPPLSIMSEDMECHVPPHLERVRSVSMDTSSSYGPPPSQLTDQPPPPPPRPTYPNPPPTQYASTPHQYTSSSLAGAMGPEPAYAQYHQAFEYPQQAHPQQPYSPGSGAGPWVAAYGAAQPVMMTPQESSSSGFSVGEGAGALGMPWAGSEREGGHAVGY